MSEQGIQLSGGCQCGTLAVRLMHPRKAEAYESYDGYIGAFGETEAGLKGVLNIKCLDDPGAFSQDATPHDFDGEETGERLAHRNRNWTPAEII